MLQYKVASLGGGYGESTFRSWWSDILNSRLTITLKLTMNIDYHFYFCNGTGDDRN